MTIVVAGSSPAEKSRLVARTAEACSGDLTLLKARLSSFAIEPELLERLRDANWVEAPDYTTLDRFRGPPGPRRRQAAVEAAVEGTC